MPESVLFVVGFWTGAPVWVVVASFGIYAFFNAVSGNLSAVYPAEIFPTDVRTSGVGLASAASRVGAAIGTWLLPVGLDHLGVGPCMVVGGGICVVGAVVSQLMAPETTGLTLTRTSSTSPTVEAAPLATAGVADTCSGSAPGGHSGTELLTRFPVQALSRRARPRARGGGGPCCG